MAVSPIQLYTSGYRALFNGAIKWAVPAAPATATNICAVLLKSTYTSVTLTDDTWSDISTHHVSSVTYPAYVPKDVYMVETDGVAGRAITPVGDNELRYTSGEVTFTTNGDITAAWLVLVACTPSAITGGTANNALLIGAVKLNGGANVASTAAVFKYSPASSGWFRLLKTAI